LVLGLSCFDSFNELLECIIFPDQFQGGVGTDFWDRVEVIAAEEDTEVDELTY